MMDRTDGTHPCLVGSVDGHFQLPMEETRRHKVSGVDGKGLVVGGGVGPGIAHAGTGHAGQDEGEGPVEDAGPSHLGRRAGHLAAEAGAVEDVLDDAGDASVGAVLLDGLDEVLGFEIVSGILDGTDERLGGVDADPVGLGGLEGLVELPLVHLDGIFVSAVGGSTCRSVGGTIVRRSAISIISTAIGIIVVAIATITTSTTAPLTAAMSKHLGSGVAVSYGLDGQIELTAIPVGVGQQQYAINAIGGPAAAARAAAPRFEGNVLADAHLAQPLPGGEGAGIVPVVVRLGGHSVQFDIFMNRTGGRENKSVHGISIGAWDIVV